jgi:hypothetical protein
VDVTALEFVNSSANTFPSTGGDSGLVTRYGIILAQELSKQLKDSGVDAKVKTASLRRETSQQGTVTTTKTYAMSTEGMMKLFEPSDHYVLIMNIQGYFVDRSTKRWIGNVSFGYMLIKPDHWTQEKKAVWELKTGLNTLNFGPSKVVSLEDQNCVKDEKIPCTSWVVRELIKTLKDQKIIVQNPN